MTNIKLKFTGDPANLKQQIPNVNIQILCCRNWLLQNWEYNDLTFPFWRLYYNSNMGGKIISKDKIYELTPNKIFIIAPNTSYSTKLQNNSIPDAMFKLSGVSKRDIPESSLSGLYIAGAVEHLFVHFNLGFPYDMISPGIFSIDVDDSMLEDISYLKNYLLHSNDSFNMTSYFRINKLIFQALLKSGTLYWNIDNKNTKIWNVLTYINHNICVNLTNCDLADIACMATNAFIRLFTTEVGISPQNYIRKRRIDKAISLLIHTDKSINMIAEETGFADRYHFSRIFKLLTKQSPASFRRQMIN